MFSVALHQSVSCPNCHLNPLHVVSMIQGIVCLHSIIKQNDLIITPENRLCDDRSAAAAM